MKRFFGYLVLMSFLLTSCQTHLKTARTADTSASLRSVAVADLDVADERITHMIVPTEELLRGGEQNVKRAVEQEALTKYGNADILLEPQYVITKRRGLFRSKITSITVSGRPARFRNFRSLNDSVWCNPVFNGVAVKQSSATAFYGGKRTKAAHRNVADRYRTKGYEWSLGIPVMYSYFEHNCWINHKEYIATTFGLLSSFGYRFGSHFYLGAGVGLLYSGIDDNLFLPIYADMRFDFLKKKKTPFLDFKFGYTAADIADGGEADVFYAVALGYSFGKFEVALQGMNMGYVNECDAIGSYYRTCDSSYDILGMVGLTFNFVF